MKKLFGHGSTTPSRDATHRRGMTLFEILLVLVLLVVVSSLAVPLFEGSFATVRLRRGSDQVLAAWSDARVQAVQTGQTHEFLFQSESGLYRVQPWQVQQVSDAITDPTAVAPIADDSTQAVWLPYEAELPEEIMFAEGDAITLTAANERTVETLNQSGESVWSAPILFFPDGSTSSASLLLRNERRLFQRVTLRALTGVARVSDVLTEDEVEQLKGR
ncbi:MAG: prepilin-type N-terminal cleavage/methylation domain-containing protein [Planctomycetes bacterium]|nr:prepilin-type N-terminal cleavage/methylation domain-containing protein [Planctomycetota bacterium]